MRHAETSLDINLRVRRRRELDQVKKAMQELDATDTQLVTGELESVLGRLESLAVEVRQLKKLIYHSLVIRKD